jgi:hypothetical protein
MFIEFFLNDVFFSMMILFAFYQIFNWDLLSSIGSFLSAWMTVVVTVFAFFAWKDFKKQKAIELYDALNNIKFNIEEILSKMNFYEYDGYFPDKIPTESIGKTEVWKSKFRPHRLIYNEFQTIKKQFRNHWISQDEQIQQSCKNIEQLLKNISGNLNAQNHPDQKDIEQGYLSLKKSSIQLQTEITKLSEYLSKKI